jgi:hydrogenase maturation factor HypF (carbamoyltransferase family)
MELVDAMLSRGIQTVPTSSCGRLFDAVAAMLGLGSEVTFEGQAAIALEMAADSTVADRYDFDLEESNSIAVNLRPTIAGIVEDIARSQPVRAISARFHNTLSAATVEVCGLIRKNDGLDRVCLSGGSFRTTFYWQKRQPDCAVADLEYSYTRWSRRTMAESRWPGRHRQRDVAARKLRGRPTCVWPYPAKL